MRAHRCSRRKLIANAHEVIDSRSYTGWMDVNLAIRAGGDMMLCLMGVNLDSSSNAAQQEMRRACHNILYTQANSAAADISPYWLVLLVILNTAVISAALFVFLGHTKLALIFWACLFRYGGVAAADSNDSQPIESEEPAKAEEPVQSDEPVPADDPTGGVYVQMEDPSAGEENAWLVTHVTLRNDGTFTITVD